MKPWFDDDNGLVNDSQQRHAQGTSDDGDDLKGSTVQERNSPLFRPSICMCDSTFSN